MHHADARSLCARPQRFFLFSTSKKERRVSFCTCRHAALCSSALTLLCSRSPADREDGVLCAAHGVSDRLGRQTAGQLLLKGMHMRQISWYRCVCVCVNLRWVPWLRLPADVSQERHGGAFKLGFTPEGHFPGPNQGGRWFTVVIFLHRSGLLSQGLNGPKNWQKSLQKSANFV